MLDCRFSVMINSTTRLLVTGTVFALHTVSYNINRSSSSTMNDTLVRAEINQFIAKTNFWITIIELLMVVCGILGNGLALIVINRRSLRDTSSSVFITYLAIFDIAVLVVNVTNLATSRWFHSFILHCCLLFLTDLVTFCSVWIMVIMTLERCVAVRSPFLAKRFCTTERARCSIYILIIVAFVFFATTFPIIYITDSEQQKCGVRARYQMIIRFVKPTIFYFVPDFLLLANIFVIYELCMAKRQRTQTLMNPENAMNQLNAASFNRKQRQLTVMLVTVCLSFYLFTTPAIVDYISQIYPPKHHNIRQLKMRFLRANLTVLWLQMSSATNFLFYCLAGSKFRAVCWETLSDAFNYIRVKHHDDDFGNTRRQLRRKSETTCISMHTAHEMRNGIQSDRKQRRSTSILQTHPLTNASKRPSIETILSSQLNSRRQSRCAMNVHEF